MHAFCDVKEINTNPREPRSRMSSEQEKMFFISILYGTVGDYDWVDARLQEMADAENNSEQDPQLDPVKAAYIASMFSTVGDYDWVDARLQEMADEEKKNEWVSKQQLNEYHQLRKLERKMNSV